MHSNGANDSNQFTYPCGSPSCRTDSPRSDSICASMPIVPFIDLAMSRGAHASVSASRLLRYWRRFQCCKQDLYVARHGTPSDHLWPESMNASQHLFSNRTLERSRHDLRQRLEDFWNRRLGSAGLRPDLATCANSCPLALSAAQRRAAQPRAALTITSPPQLAAHAPLVGCGGYSGGPASVRQGPESSHTLARLFAFPPLV